MLKIQLQRALDIDDDNDEAADLIERFENELRGEYQAEIAALQGFRDECERQFQEKVNEIAAREERIVKRDRWLDAWEHLGRSLYKQATGKTVEHFGDHEIGEVQRVVLAYVQAAPLSARVRELEAALDFTYRLLDECDHAGRSAPECPFCHPSARLDLAASATTESVPDAQNWVVGPLDRDEYYKRFRKPAPDSRDAVVAAGLKVIDAMPGSFTAGEFITHDGASTLNKLRRAVNDYLVAAAPTEKRQNWAERIKIAKEARDAGAQLRADPQGARRRRESEAG